MTASPLTWLTRLAYTALCLAIIAASVGLAGAASFELTNRGRVFPGVRSWGLNLSGQSAGESAVALSAAFNYPQSAAITFHDGERTWSVTPAELGLTLDLPASINAVYAVGRSGNPVLDWPAQFDAWYFGRQVAPVATYAEGRTLIYLNRLAEEVFRPTIEASLAVDGTRVSATPGQIGRQLDVLATAAQVRQALTQLAAADIPLAYVETPPQVLDAAPQAAEAEALLSQPLALTITQPLPDDPGPWSVSPETLGGLLRIRRVPAGTNGAYFQVGLDEAGLRAILEPLAPGLEREPRDARFVFNDETRQLDVIEHSIPQRSLDVEASLAAIQAALAAGQHSAALAFQITPPAVPDDLQASQVGITQLVSEQSTLFRGSSAERIKNIQVAAARFHGVMVPPNAVFSFNQYLGDVSLDSGFAEALIIFGGRTIRGVGGGVCQVSTTLLRAVYFGGYPVSERYSHAYRVGYYERSDPGLWAGPGLDATVFAPLVDFKFQNDSPHWLLMEVYVNAAAGRMTWKFYSTPDGRQVTVGAPDVREVVAAPEPLYEENPDLKAGEIKQVDYAADGADVTVYRVITRDGVVINRAERPLTTHYQPWRAIFQYGPGTPDMPPTPAPTPTP